MAYRLQRSQAMALTVEVKWQKANNPGKKVVMLIEKTKFLEECVLTTSDGVHLTLKDSDLSLGGLYWLQHYCWKTKLTQCPKSMFSSIFT